MSFQKKKYLFIVLLLCIFTMKCTLAFAKKTAKDNLSNFGDSFL